MANDDDVTRRIPEDPKNVNVEKEWELRYWTNFLDISEDTLKSAVGAVGTDAGKVKEWLADNG